MTRSMSPFAFVALALFATDLRAATPDSAKVVELAVTSHGAYDVAVSVADEVGARIAGSPAAARVVVWAEQKMKSLGLANVHTEPVVVEAWTRGTADRVELLGAYARPLRTLALGRSPGTPVTGITADVVEVDSFEALAKLGDKARGKIVFFNRTMLRSQSFEQYGSVGALRFRGALEAAKVGAVAALVRSIGTGSHRLPHTGATSYDPTGTAIPFAALALEDAELLHRALARGPQKIKMTLGCGMRGPVSSSNVVGEVRGKEKPEEIVVVGAHLDSWDVGDGALDDGAGIGIVLETARLLKAVGGGKRTLRVVLFMNEEYGLSGAKAYARDHAAELDRHVAAMEADAGGGTPLHLIVAGGEAHKSMVDRLARPLAKYKIDRVEIVPDTGADVSVLQDFGVPTVGVAQDVSDYFEWHHTDGDTADKLIPAQLDLAAGIFAAIAVSLVEAKELLPRVEQHAPAK